MPSADLVRARVAELRRRVDDERARAMRAAAIAARYEVSCEQPPASLQPLRVRMAALHRRLESRHLESARLHELYAARLRSWVQFADATATRPMFIDAVAAAIGSASTAMTLLGHEGTEALAATSDPTARMAHDVEFVMGEGPAHEVAAAAASLQVDATELCERWPRYGPIVADKGVGAVVGVPLRQEPGGCIGALCVYTAASTVAPEVAAASSRVADALTHTVLNLPGTVPDDETPAASMFDESAFHDTIHQAAGIVSVRHACDTGSALALLRARAFADGAPIESLARRVIDGQVDI